MTEETTLPLYRLEVFRAIDDPERSRHHAEQYQRHLLTLGINGLKSSETIWLSNPNVVVLSMYSGETIVGGGRLHVAHPDYPFPLIKAMGYRHAAVTEFDEIGHPLTAEGCGLWMSRKHSGRGLMEFISRAAILSAEGLGLETTYAICPRHTLDAFRSMGFLMIQDEHKPLRFPYPTSRYTSYLIQCPLSDKEFALRSERIKMLELQSAKKMNHNSLGPAGECLVSISGLPSISMKSQMLGEMQLGKKIPTSKSKVHTVSIGAKDKSNLSTPSR